MTYWAGSYIGLRTSLYPLRSRWIKISVIEDLRRSRPPGLASRDVFERIVKLVELSAFVCNEAPTSVKRSTKYAGAL